jgi:hypothetical protein
MTDPVHHLNPNAPFVYGTSWEWREPAHGEHFRRCNYCGSIHPDDLAAEQPGTGCGFDGCPAPHDPLADLHYPMPGTDQTADGHRFVETGWRAQWADRKYGYPHKFYVDVVNRDPERLYVLGSANHIVKADEPGYANWQLVADLGEAGRAALDRDYPPGHEKYRPTGSVLLGTRPVHNAKFYTMHLADHAISEETKDKIAEVSGLRFRFFDRGRIGWEPTHAAS